MPLKYEYFDMEPRGVVVNQRTKLGKFEFYAEVKTFECNFVLGGPFRDYTEAKKVADEKALEIKTVMLEVCRKMTSTLKKAKE